MALLKLPTILLTFADYRNDLPGLDGESGTLKDILLKLEQEGYLNVEREESADLDEVYKRIQDYKNEMVIFHYAGHAGPQSIYLEKGDGVRADAIAELLGQAPYLQLVFLNGCETEEQIAKLLDKGVKTVIASTRKVGDKEAFEFARRFYLSLANKDSIQDAFTAANSLVGAGNEGQEKRGFEIPQEKEQENQGSPWIIRGSEAGLKWRISHNERTRLNLIQGSRIMLRKLMQNLSETHQTQVNAILEHEGQTKETDTTKIKAEIRKMEQENQSASNDLEASTITSALSSLKDIIKDIDEIFKADQFVKVTLEPASDDMINIIPGFERAKKAAVDLEKLQEKEPDVFKILKSSLLGLRQHLQSISDSHPEKEDDGPQTHGSRQGSTDEIPETIRSLKIVLEMLWQRGTPDSRHAVLTGDSGSGKTGAIIQMWAELLARVDGERLVPIPIFVNLSDYRGKEDTNFITNYIARHYLQAEGVSDPDETGQIKEIMQEPLKGHRRHPLQPSVILFLDGDILTPILNPLNAEIWELKKKNGLQIIYCTGAPVKQAASDDPPLNELEGIANILKIKPSDPREIIQKIDLNRFRGEIKELVKTRKWLTRLYEFHDKIDDSGYDFKYKFSTEGEFLWNFFEAKLSRLGEEEQSESQSIRRFYLRFFIPNIIFRMHQLGKKEIEEEKLFEVISEISSRFYQRKFLKVFPVFRRHFRSFMLTPATWVEKEEQFALITGMCQEFGILIRIGQNYHSANEEIFDFFVAVHLHNDIEKAMWDSKYQRDEIEIPESLWDRQFPLQTLKFLGQIEGLHHSFTDPPAIKLLERSRKNKINTREPKTANAVYNLIHALKEAKGYYPADLRNLDLRNMDLSRLSTTLSEYPFYLPCQLDGALIRREDLLGISKQEAQINDLLFYQADETQTLVCAVSDGTIRLWDLQGKGICYKIIRTRCPDVVAISMAGNYLISASEKHIYIWDLKKSAELVMTLPNDNLPAGSLLQCLASWSDEKEENSPLWIVAGTGDEKTGNSGRTNSLLHWKVTSGKEAELIFQKEHQHNDDVKCVAISPLRTMIATGSWDHNVRLWNREQKKWQERYKKHVSRVNSVAFSDVRDDRRDSQYLASASNDDTIIVWDLESDKFRRLSGHSRNVNCVQLKTLHGQSFLISGGEDGQVILWNLDKIWKSRTIKLKPDSKNLPVSKRDINDPITSIRISDDGKRIAAGTYSGIVHLWEIGQFWDFEANIPVIPKDDAPHPKGEKGQELNNTYNLQVQGCRIFLKDLHSESDLKTGNQSEIDQEILRQYGAITTGEDEEDWKKILEKLKKEAHQNRGDAG